MTSSLHRARAGALPGPPRPVARSLRAEWARLAAGAADPPRFTADLAGGLPEPARRWLGHAVAAGTPLWSSVELRMRGQIDLGGWKPFTARQVLAPPDGFIWAATARVAGLPVTGHDRYGTGGGRMRWRLAGLVPVLSAAGPDVTRSATGRLAGEGTVWLPTRFATASWSAGPDADTAVATWRIGDHEEAVQLRVGPGGELREVLLQRWGNPERRPFGLFPFSVAVDEERTFAGVTVPSVIRATWWTGERRPAGREFYRAEITDAAFR